MGGRCDPGYQGPGSEELELVAMNREDWLKPLKKTWVHTGLSSRMIYLLNMYRCDAVLMIIFYEYVLFFFILLVM
jgi:hypothetical protein